MNSYQSYNQIRLNNVDYFEAYPEKPWVSQMINLCGIPFVLSSSCSCKNQEAVFNLQDPVKKKMQGLLFKNDEDFQDGNSRALN